MHPRLWLFSRATRYHLLPPGSIGQRWTCASGWHGGEALADQAHPRLRQAAAGAVGCWVGVCVLGNHPVLLENSPAPAPSWSVIGVSGPGSPACHPGQGLTADFLTKPHSYLELVTVNDRSANNSGIPYTDRPPRNDRIRQRRRPWARVLYFRSLFHTEVGSSGRDTSVLPPADQPVRLTMLEI